MNNPLERISKDSNTQLLFSHTESNDISELHECLLIEMGFIQLNNESFAHLCKGLTIEQHKQGYYLNGKLAGSFESVLHKLLLYADNKGHISVIISGYTIHIDSKGMSYESVDALNYLNTFYEYTSITKGLSDLNLSISVDRYFTEKDGLLYDAPFINNEAMAV